MPRSARRRQLLAAAQEVFVAAGYHAAAMDDIAERAGVSKPVLYQHFPSKRELYLALLEASAEKLERAVTDALASSSDNHERVAASIDAYYAFVTDRAGAYRLVFESDLLGEPAVRERIEATLATSIGAIADTIARDTGLAREEAELLSCGLAGLAETSARWWLRSGSAIERERAVALMTGLIWRGISGFPRTSAES